MKKIFILLFIYMSFFLVVIFISSCVFFDLEKEMAEYEETSGLVGQV